MGKIVTPNFGQELLCDFLLNRIQALAEELLGVLANPLLLWCLSEAAPEMVRTMRLLQHSTPALGDWCVYGCLDPSLCGESLISVNGRQVQGLRSFDDSKLNEKLEKSVLSFLLNHQLLWLPDDGREDDCPAEYFNDYSPPMCSTGASSPRSFAHGIPLQNFEGLNGGNGASMAPVSMEMSETVEWHADGPPGESPPTNIQHTLPISWHAEGNHSDGKKQSNEPNDWALTHILGAPPNATKLLKEVQEFEETEMKANGSGENYSMLPAELVRLPPITPGAPAHVAIENAAKMAVDEQRQETWLLTLRFKYRHV